MYSVDTLIVGGGVAGSLVAAKLVGHGYSSLLVESTALASAQSGHSHGYIHRGYIYLNGNTGLVKQLKSARAEWDIYISYPDRVLPCTTESLIGFSNQDIANYAAQSWRNSGLPVVRMAPSDWPALLSATQILKSCFLTEEQSYDFTKVIKNIKSRLTSSNVLTATVLKLCVKNSFCYAVEMEVNGAIRRVSARYVVLAAGIGNADILARTFGKYRTSPKVRTSYMLVISGAALQPISMILPEHPFYGFFLVSRIAEGKVTWLLSNYISYGGLSGESGCAARLWARSAVRTIDSIFPFLRGAELAWGLYAAPKAEYRRDPEYLPDGKVFESFGMKNVVAVWPTKLSLAPIGAEEVANIVLKEIGASHPIYPDSSDWFSSTPDTKIAEETWKSVTLQTRLEFETKYGIS